ncbi:unnamed protein product [Phytomonas sp. EM1]|nr:unnamed protein product [Phytomonas sp. EM1]|eukprot:CCW64967.1 unnamed protein product [Phytomonas sp. isolate EM1]
MRRKNQEVCGKPTEYNLQTMEYNRRELPNTRIQPLKQEPRVRYYPQPTVATDAHARGNKANYNDGLSQELKVPEQRLPSMQKNRHLESGENPQRRSRTPIDVGNAISFPGAPVFERGENNHQLVPALDRDRRLPDVSPPRPLPEFSPREIISMLPWSHEAIRHAVASNRIEANRSYLPH